MEQDKQALDAIAALFEATRLLINDAVIEAKGNSPRIGELVSARRQLNEAQYAFRS